MPFGQTKKYPKQTYKTSAERRQIAQELECNFNSSGETVLQAEDMEWTLSCVTEPTYRTGFDRNFWIWEKYQDDSKYLLVADVARGDGADYSVFHIFKLETMEVIAEYQGKVTPDMFSDMVFNGHGSSSGRGVHATCGVCYYLLHATCTTTTNTAQAL